MVFDFKLTHPDHGVPFYGVTSAESEEEAREQLLRQAEQRQARHEEINADDSDETRVVVPADELEVELVPRG